jgi:hypothetical protein
LPRAPDGSSGEKRLEESELLGHVFSNSAGPSVRSHDGLPMVTAHASLAQV